MIFRFSVSAFFGRPQICQHLSNIRKLIFGYRYKTFHINKKILGLKCKIYTKEESLISNTKTELKSAGLFKSCKSFSKNILLFIIEKNLLLKKLPGLLHNS